MESNYQQCTRCVMDTTTQLIRFDEDGVCNFCKGYESDILQPFREKEAEKRKELEFQIAEIRKYGQGKKYDCLIGISGGMDSSYLAVLAKDFGLRPLIVHFDNGWNSELAVKNIENIVTRCKFDLYTHVIDWELFKDLQLAYFKASVIDIEVPTDQLILAILYKIAKEKNIKYILAGNNVITEHILPKDWCFWNKWDLVNLRNIYRKYGTKNLKNFPTFSYKDQYYYKNILGITSITFFDKLFFDVKKVKERLTKEFDYNVYSCKHFESVFTRFYQGYILPRKFGVDKRKAHFSCLIMSGQISREEVMVELRHPTYAEELQREDREYVIKKWELSDEVFDRIMHQIPVPHEAFGIEKKPFYIRMKKKLELIYLYKFAYPLGLKKKTTS